MNVKIRKGDQVEVICCAKSEEIGKRGEVVKVLPSKNRVVVQGVNMRTKHQRQVQSEGRTITPGKVHFEGPMDVSNVMLVCPKCNKTTRVALVRDDEKVQRVCKKCQALIDE